LIELAITDAATAEERDHLATCPYCRAELESTRHVARLVAAADDVQATAAAPDRLWAAIRADRRQDPPRGRGSSSFVA
jgi:anti-sigma factor RsiW